MDYTTKILKEHTGILAGTIKTCDCDPLMDCPECHGTGTCQECNGKGDVDCYSCHGSGRCTDCGGKGQWSCDECGGTGMCRRCNGTGDVTCNNCNGSGKVFYKAVSGSGASDGYKDCPKCGGSGSTPCPDCRSGMQTAAKALDTLTFGAGRSYGHGSGKCSKCGGSGDITCKTCHGSGDCKTCNGSGTLTCDHCHGSGDCPNCNNGKVTCERCQGSGNYQTFIRRKTTLYSKEWRWSGTTQYKDIIGASYGLTVYDGPVKKWKDAIEVEADIVDKVNNECKTALGNEKELYEEFLENYAGQTSLLKPDNFSDKPYAKELKVQKVPVTKIKYTINDENYELMVVGNNHIVAVKSIPTVINGFELTKWEKIKLAMTEKSRIKAFARLAAYIFQCDGKSKEESVVLDSLIKSLRMDYSKEAGFKLELDEFNSRMPYNKVRKFIKPLLKSKKTITFAWQCMAVDKQITPEEEELFNNIVAEYDLSPSEVDRLKGLAKKFTKLKPEQIAIKYADLSPEFEAIRKKVWKTILFSISGVIGIIAIVLAVVFMPKDSFKSSSYDSVDKMISATGADIETPDIVEADTLDVMQESDKTTEEEEKSADQIVAEAYEQMGNESASNDNSNTPGYFPEASDRLLTDAELASKDKETLRLMRNEIYARHGYIFKSADLREHFEHQYWYLGEHKDVSNMLTPTEKKNVALIQKYENR